MVVTVKNSAGTMLAYTGQTVTLSFAATADESLQTSFVLDGISLMIQ